MKSKVRLGTDPHSRERQFHRLIHPKELHKFGILYHPNHIRRMVKNGQFPAPVRLSPHRIAWPEDVIEAWIESRIIGR
jgi:predicted DNA-binding transcriptional regulator AlpA